ncbi:MAG: aldehyde dehydrogenase [Clostridia bacterium]|nr:aldehyde dehydrogenase [Clostridia bacterium]
MNIEQLLQTQREYFRTGETLPVSFRIKMLRKLYEAVKRREVDICNALKEDLGKSSTEAFMCEAGLALTEISYMIRHVKRFAAEKKVRTPLYQFASRSYTKASPYGNVLIMSPWNYPFLLTIEPLTDAIAAGNTAIVKPSAYSPSTSAIVAEIISECFEPRYVACVTGGRRENSELLNQKFDMIFFTGSTNVGKEVLRHAAENLTPAVLELGGKSPCIVDETAKLPLAARRIVFGKFLNCGQTCVAPDYVLCHESVRDELISQMKREITRQFGESPINNSDYGNIINEKHFDRLISLIDPKKVACGGINCREKLKIAPTLMSGVTWDDAVMGEEIFGPILPVLTYKNLGDVIHTLQGKSKPLAMYVFSENKRTQKLLTTRLAFGGGCINDCVIHLATSEMPFGGVGESGMGAYHGKAGFDAFSHTKSIVDKKTFMDLRMRYQPYEKFYAKMIRMFLK